VYTRTTVTAVLARWLVQHAITAHSRQDTTWFFLERPEKVVVPILAIGHDEVKDPEHLGLPGMTQLLDLLHANLDIRLLTRNPMDREWWRPTGVSLWCPGQHRIRMPYDDWRAKARVRATMDVLPVSHGSCGSVSPSCGVQRKY
jgi:hypothetical protein